MDVPAGCALMSILQVRISCVLNVVASASVPAVQVDPASRDTSTVKSVFGVQASTSSCQIAANAVSGWDRAVKVSDTMTEFRTVCAKVMSSTTSNAPFGVFWAKQI